MLININIKQKTKRKTKNKKNKPLKTYSWIRKVYLEQPLFSKLEGVFITFC